MAQAAVNKNPRFLQVRRYWEVLSVLVSRNLKVRYRGSYLGIYWSLLNPLIMTSVYTAIFGTAFAKYYTTSPLPPSLNYVLAVFTGLVIVNFYSASTSQALISVVNNGPLLNKIQLPTSVFPLSILGANLFQFSLGSLPLLAIVTLITSHSLLNVFLLLVPLLSLVLACMGVSFMVSSLFVFFRDLPYLYELVNFVLLIGTPVFYPVDIVPDRIRVIMALNPLFSIIESTRQIAIKSQLPDPLLLLTAFLGGVILLGIGWVCFQITKPHFMDLV